ncbi:MAG: RlmE family RNA methyltransferase [Myxococcales bacterium]|nr:RlmE family RNA methyltransferase [Myxococcales bacterium]
MRRRARRQARPQDSFGKRAQKEGYAARSVYKLQEIDRRVRLLRRGMRVLDLGAAPGSWTQYAAEQVGREGKVLGVDLQPAGVSLPPQACFDQLDITTATAASLGGPEAFEVVLSDMAPRTSGMRHRDQFLSFELYVRALEIAEQTLVAGGTFVGKIFQGGEFEQARDATRARFRTVRIIKPEASRNESYEVFLVGLDRLPTPGATSSA